VNLFGYVLILCGVLLEIVGMLLAVMYVWEAVIERIGDADQSLLFWYLPLLMFGLIEVIGGWAMVRAGRARLKNQKRNDHNG
jgi:hypothetical protein